MKKIALLLMEYGFDFQYENRCSNGEKIMCFDISLEVSTQQGKIYFEHEGENEEYEEKEVLFEYIKNRIERILIKETT